MTIICFIDESLLCHKKQNLSVSVSRNMFFIEFGIHFNEVLILS